MSPINILFAGTSAFAVPSLHALAADPRFVVTHVITQPDRPAGRKQIVTPSPVKVAAIEHGLPVLQPESLNKDESVFALPRPDFLVVISYGQILSQRLLDIPLIAPVNVHASLLPRWRGASPIQHAILAGDQETGVSVQRMVRELDAGPILARERVEIDAEETTPALHDTLSALAAKLLIPALLQPLQPVEQDASKATFCRKLSREDGVVDPAAMTAQEIDRKVRALVPWPGVSWNGAKILATSLEASENAMLLDCAKGTRLFILKIQPAGGKPMNGAEFARGRR